LLVDPKRSQGFIQYDADGRREVQGTYVACDWNMIDSVGIGVENGPGKSFGFRAEHEKHSFHHRHGPEGYCTAFAEKEYFICFRGHGINKGLEIRPDFQIDMLPVIQTGPFDPSTIQGKAKGFDEMQRRSGTETGSADVAGIPVDVG